MRVVYFVLFYFSGCRINFNFVFKSKKKNGNEANKCRLDLIGQTGDLFKQAGHWTDSTRCYRYLAGLHYRFSASSCCLLAYGVYLTTDSSRWCVHLFICNQITHSTSLIQSTRLMSTLCLSVVLLDATCVDFLFGYNIDKDSFISFRHIPTPLFTSVISVGPRIHLVLLASRSSKRIKNVLVG